MPTSKRFRRPYYYILQGKLAVPVKTLEEFGARFEHKNRFVAQTKIGGVVVSTVFLGIDHSFSTAPEALPILFETMVFRGGKGDDMERCGSWEEAEAQHKAMVAKVRAEIRAKVND